MKKLVFLMTCTLPLLSMVNLSHAGDTLPLTINSTASASEVQRIFNFLANKQINDGRYFIALDTESALRLKTGDTFKLKLTNDGEVLTATVDSHSSFEGIYRLKGSLKDDSGALFDGDFGMTLSPKDKYISANFMMGEKSYSMETKQGLGWIVNADNTEKQIHEGEKGVTLPR
jgi:hypothetical protein